MERVTGIGGVFMRSRDPAALARWYTQHLGVDAFMDGIGRFGWGTDPEGNRFALWEPAPRRWSAADGYWVVRRL